MKLNQPLTEREKNVVAFLLQGKSNKQIAQELSVAIRTVEFHISHIYKKLGVSSRAEALIKLSENHLRETTGASFRESTVDKVREPTENGVNPIISKRRITLKKLLLYILAIVSISCLGLFVFFLVYRAGQSGISEQQIGTVQVTSVPIKYLPAQANNPTEVLSNPPDTPTPTSLPKIELLKAAPTATKIVFPPDEIHQTLASGLRIEEYALVCAPCPEPLTITTAQGTQPDIFFLPSTQLNTHPNQSFDAAGHLTSYVVVGNDTISVTEITPDSTASVNSVEIKVARNGQIMDTIQGGDVTPIDTLRGLWVFDDKHWVLEIAHVTSIIAPDNGRSLDAVGQIFQDGVFVNERNNYQAAFGFQTMNGRPFYFFKRDGRMGIVYDGQEMLLGYTEIPHYGCCSAAEKNPKNYVNGVTFLAQRDGTWYYVGIGVMAPAQKETQPAATTAPQADLNRLPGLRLTQPLEQRALAVSDSWFMI